MSEIEKSCENCINKNKCYEDRLCINNEYICFEESELSRCQRLNEKAFKSGMKLKAELSKCKHKNKLIMSLINSLCDECSSCLTGEDAVSYHEWATDIDRQLEEIDSES